MLSPARYHVEVPTDPERNLLFRRAVLEAARGDARVRAGLVEACRLDLFFYLAAFACQYNPLKPGREVGTFVPWESQHEAIRQILWCIDREKSAVMEKSREMGGTYLCLLLIDWLAKFHADKKVLVISRSAEAVDNPGDPDAIFWKLDHVNAHLPAWLRGDVDRRKMFVRYPRTRSVITGQASTGRAGVGGRAHVIFLDEFSQVREDKEVRQRTASTTNTRIFNGTHLGLDTEFYDLCQQPEMVKVRLHWTQHPDKARGLYEFDPARPGVPKILDTDYPFPADYKFVLDGSPTGGPRPGVRSPWYDAKCLDIGNARGVAMDLDINPTGSVSQVADPLKIRGLIARNCVPPYWRGRLVYDEEAASPRGLEADDRGLLWLWLHPRPDGAVPPSKYVVSGDVATGQGASPSCCSVFDSATGEKVGGYANPFIDAEDFGRYMVALCRHFLDAGGTPATLIWELNGPGDLAAKAIRAAGFRRLYERGPQGSEFLGTKKVQTGKPGWVSNPSAKNFVIGQYLKGLYSGECLNRDELAMRECLKFAYDSGGNIFHPEESAKNDPSGARINHGDRAMADALAWHVARDIGKTIIREEKEQVPYGSILWRRQQRQLQQVEEG